MIISLRRYVIDAQLKLLDMKRPNASILDVGCGSGYLCATFAELAPKDAHIYGIDNILGLVQLSERNLNRQVKRCTYFIETYIIILFLRF